MKKRRTTTTPSDPAAPYFLFGAQCQRGSEFIYICVGTMNFELHVFGFGNLVCNNSKFVCV
jgi:hypothetical protein